MGPPVRKRQSLDFLLSILIIPSPSILWKRIEFQFGRKMNISPRVVLAVLVVVALLVTPSHQKRSSRKGKRIGSRVEQGVALENQGSFGFIGSNQPAEDGGVNTSEQDRKGGWNKAGGARAGVARGNK